METSSAVSGETETGVLNSNETPRSTPDKNAHVNRAANTSSGVLDDEACPQGSSDEKSTRKVAEPEQMRVAIKEEEEEEEEEGDDEWQVWRCSVKVNREDEGSGVKLCVQTSVTRHSSMICVAEFEVGLAL